MLNLIRRCRRADERGVALIVVIMVMAIFFVLALTLVFQGETEHVGVVNEQDHLKTLGYAEAGLQWAELRIREDAQSPAFTDFTDILLGPDNSDAADDHLLGLRDLSLTNTNQFTSANEATASAIVQRDFLGDGSKSYEVIRLQDSPRTRALVYARLDDNFDDDPDDPSNNDPLTDMDKRIRATVVAVYPVFVDGNGVEMPNLGKKRGRARRTLRVSFGPTGVLAALLTNGDLDMPGNTKICVECGSAHTNQDFAISGNPSICEDATATGSWTASGNPTIGGASGARDRIFVPVINPSRRNVKRVGAGPEPDMPSPRRRATPSSAREPRSH